MTWNPFLTFPLRKCKEFQPSTEGVDRRARRSHLYRGEVIKPCLQSLSLPQGPPVLPVKLWGSYGCNEVVGTEVAITAQLNCHQRLMEALDQALTDSKYLQIPPEARMLSRLAVSVADHFNYYFFFLMEHLKSRLQEVCGLCEASSVAAESYLSVSPDLSDGNLCGAKANILRPLQRLAKYQFFHTANVTVIMQPNVSGCRRVCIYLRIQCLIVSECCKYFTCILETQSVHPILVNA